MHSLHGKSIVLQYVFRCPLVFLNKCFGFPPIICPGVETWFPRFLTGDLPPLALGYRERQSLLNVDKVLRSLLLKADVAGSTKYVMEADGFEN